MNFKVMKTIVLKSVMSMMFLFGIAVVVSVCTGTEVSAAKIIDNGDYTYEVLEDGKSAAIKNYKGESLYVSLPSRVEDYTVTEVSSSAFMSNHTIKELEICDTIKKIDSNAFAECTALQKLQIPGNVEIIGDSAFQNCTELSSLTIYDGTKRIGHYAFAGCISLGELKLPNHLEEIGDYAFFNCSSLENVSIPNGIESFGGYALEGTKWIKNQKSEFVIVGDGILIKYNSDKKYISLSDKVKTIGKYSFAENKSVNTVLVSPETKKIESSAFENCTALEVVRIHPDSVEEINSRAFYDCKSLNNITLPNSTAKIDKHTFGNCEGLEMITIPSNVITVSEGAFEGCIQLENLTIMGGLQNIETDAFKDCKNLRRIIFPTTLRKIQKSAFSNCSSLTRVEFNSDIMLEPLAFTDCVNISEAVFYVNIKELQPNAFENSPMLTLYSDNNYYLQEYAEKNKIQNDHIKNLAEYQDKGNIPVEPPKEVSGFSGTYTLIVVMIIIVDIALVVLFSFYIIFVVPNGRHSRQTTIRVPRGGKYSKRPTPRNQNRSSRTPPRTK